MQMQATTGTGIENYANTTNSDQNYRQTVQIKINIISSNEENRKTVQ